MIVDLLTVISGGIMMNVSMVFGFHIQDVQLTNYFCIHNLNDFKWNKSLVYYLNLNTY